MALIALCTSADSGPIPCRPSLVLFLRQSEDAQTPHARRRLSEQIHEMGDGGTGWCLNASVGQFSSKTERRFDATLQDLLCPCNARDRAG